jgi:hypothetical protein
VYVASDTQDLFQRYAFSVMHVRASSWEQQLNEDRLVMTLDRGSGYCMDVNENLVGNQFLHTVHLSRLQTSIIRQGILAREVGYG